MYKFITFGLLFTILVQTSVSAPSYQFLPPKDGYVPVYIRLGDTPLDKINPALAAAFHENGIAGRDLKTEFMQSDQPKSAPESEEKQKSAIQSEKNDKLNHSEPIEDDNHNHKSSATNETIAKGKASASSESDESKSSSEEKRSHVKPFENIPKNVDV